MRFTEYLRLQSPGFVPKLLRGFSPKNVLQKYPDAARIAGTRQGVGQGKVSGGWGGSGDAGDTSCNSGLSNT